MKLSHTLKQTAVATFLTTTAMLVQAHSPFIAPQTYIIDGETAAVLGGYAEVPFASEFAISGFDIRVINPNGEVQKLEPQASKHLTIADVITKEDGTYKVIAQKESKNEFVHINDKWYRVMENHSDTLPALTERSFATPAEVPADAKKLNTTSHSQLVSFFSKDKVTDQALKASSQGLEVGFATHPNALKTGQAVTLTVNVNGKPQQNFEVGALKQILSVDEKEIKIEQKTNQQGQVKITFPKAGQYLIEVSSPATAKGAAPATESYRQNIAVQVN